MDAIILAGGLGSRLRPLTQTTPKPLLPVGGVPLVFQLLHRAAAAGVRRAVLATSYQAEAFTRAVARNAMGGLELRFTTEATPLGTGGALRLAVDALDGDPADVLLVLNGDLLSSHDIGAQIDQLSAAEPRADLCLHGRVVPDARPYGCIVADAGDRVQAFVEKSPTPPSQLVNAGTYAVRRSVLSAIPSGVVASFERDVLPGLVEAGRVVVHREEAYFCDVGSPQALVEASRDVVLGRVPGAQLRSDGARPDGSWVDPTASIEPSAELVECVVLAGSRVGAGAHLTRCVLGHESVVGADVRLEDVALGDRARVSQHTAPPSGTRVDADTEWSPGSP